jgi:branched-subunit amino acid transport protein AzlD
MELGHRWTCEFTSMVGLAIRIIPTIWGIPDAIECLFLDKSLELKSSLRSFVLGCIVIDIKFGRFSPILASQFEIKIFPCFVLTDLVFLCMKEFEVSRPLTCIFAIVSIFVLHLVESETVFSCFRPLTKIQRELFTKPFIFSSSFCELSNIENKLTFCLSQKWV